MAPACRDKLRYPSASGGVATVAIDPRSKAFEERAETTEVGRHEGHVGTLVDQDPLDRTVETTQVPNARFREDLVEVDE